MARYGIPIWVPRDVVPPAERDYGRSADYEAVLEGNPQADTLRAGFDAMAALL